MKVAELILMLQEMPGSAEVVIADADTGWLLNKPSVNYDDSENYVIFASSYDKRIES